MPNSEGRNRVPLATTSVLARGYLFYFVLYSSLKTKNPADKGPILRFPIGHRPLARETPPRTERQD